MNFNEKFKKIMEEVEKNMESPKDLEYIKTTFSKMMLKFLEEMDSFTDKHIEKLQELEEKQKVLEEKSTQLEDMVKRIEKDIYVNENYDFEIVCPYCNCEFETEFDETKKEIRCPECNNVIELDWNEENDECTHDCSCCHGVCDEEDEEDKEEEKSSLEDQEDM